MIVVTGGAGFIGSNLVASLRETTDERIVVVDHPTRAHVAARIAEGSIGEVIAPLEFLDRLDRGDPDLDDVRAVLHQGARTSTLDDDRRGVLADNYEYSTRLFAATLARGIPLIYASSAAVYGRTELCVEDSALERPLNVYAESKALFDAWVRDRLSEATSQVVGLRYFNVYGPGEDHKGPMASIVTQLDDLLAAGRPATLFGAGCGAAAGEHRRDFVYVADVVAVIRWFLERPSLSGIFNCGTGTARTFNEVAAQVIAARGHGTIEYVDFPEALADRYQPATLADLGRLRGAGCDVAFRPIEEGIAAYLARRTPTGVA